MWFTLDDARRILMTTYGRSQKAVNLRRDPKAALLVESGERYDELKGVLIRGRAEVLEDEELCVRVLTAIHTKHYGALAGDVAEVMRAQARKRVVVRDHARTRRQLGSPEARRRVLIVGRREAGARPRTPSNATVRPTPRPRSR